MSEDCTPLPGVSLATGEMYRPPRTSSLREDGRGGQRRPVASQCSAAQLLPEVPCRGQLSLLAFLAPVLLCAGASGKCTTEDRSSLILRLHWFCCCCFVFQGDMEKCLSFTTRHTHTHCGFCCRGLPSFPELLTMYFRPDLKT